ncbi:hypothetical protein ACU4GD_22360 [Cupriavidus basilensis]
MVQSVKRMVLLAPPGPEYSQAADRKPRQVQAKEHLAILDAIAEQDALKAASLMPRASRKVPDVAWSSRQHDFQERSLNRRDLGRAAAGFFSP